MKHIRINDARCFAKATQALSKILTKRRLHRRFCRQHNKHYVIDAFAVSTTRKTTCAALRWCISITPARIALPSVNGKSYRKLRQKLEHRCICLHIFSRIRCMYRRCAPHPRPGLVSFVFFTQFLSLIIFLVVSTKTSPCVRPPDSHSSDIYVQKLAHNMWVLGTHEYCFEWSRTHTSEWKAGIIKITCCAPEAPTLLDVKTYQFSFVHHFTSLRSVSQFGTVQ